MVKAVKQIMSKADQAREDAHLAMLAYWVTLRAFHGAAMFVYIAVHAGTKELYFLFN